MILLLLFALGLTLYPPVSNYVNRRYASEIRTAYQVTAPCKMILGEWLDIMTVDNSSANAEAPLTVVNTRGFDLPKTGDNGTMMFTVVGILQMVGAVAVLYMVSSKKNA